MDVFVSFCVGSAVLSMVLALIFMLRSQEAARKAVSFADDARNWMNDALSERLCVQAIEEEVEQRATGLEAWGKSLVEKLEGAESLAVKYAEKAERFSETADFSQQAAESYFLQTREQADKVVEIAEVVKIEVAKIETLIAKLNKDRAENPPFVAITYGEESGEPEKVELGTKEKKFADGAVKIINEHRDEILKAIEDMKTFNYGYVMPNLWPGVTAGHLVVDKDGRVKSCGTQDVAHAVSLDPEPCGGTVTALPAGQPFEFKPTQVHPVVTEGGE